jgi:hypothetical protein
MEALAPTVRRPPARQLFLELALMSLEVLALRIRLSARFLAYF